MSPTKASPAVDQATASPSLEAKAAVTAKVKAGRAPAKAKADTVIKPQDWVTVGTIGGLELGIKSGVRDTTSGAQHLNKYKPTPLEQQSPSPAPSRTVRSSGSPPSPSAASGSNTKKPHSKYAKEFVQMAIPTPAIQALVDQLATKGVTFGPELCQDETVRFLNGVEFTTFRIDIKKLPTTWTRDGQSRSIKLGAELTKVGKDLVAAVVFNLALKYKGPRVADVAQAPMALKFEAVSVEVTGAAADCIDPEEAVANESWAEKVDRLGMSEGWFEGGFECM